MASPSILNSKDSILDVFDHFREDLDNHNDRRERLIKVRALFLTSCVLNLPHPEAVLHLLYSSNLSYLSYLAVQP